jgi:hypothetical protein
MCKQPPDLSNGFSQQPPFFLVLPEGLVVLAQIFPLDSSVMVCHATSWIMMGDWLQDLQGKIDITGSIPCHFHSFSE